MIVYEETNFCHRLLLHDRQVRSLRKACISANVVNQPKFIKNTTIEINTVSWQEDTLEDILDHYWIPLIKNAIQLLAKSVLISKTLIVSNGEMWNIIKIVKYLQESGLLIKGVTQTTEI